MSTTRYFTPQDAEGLQQFVQGVEPDGWYQFDRVGLSVAALPGITIPTGTTGVLIQAVTDMRYCLSPTEAQAGTGAYLTLPAGGYLELPGQEAVYQFCVYLDSTPTTFTIAWLTGSIGPMPWIHQPTTGGIIPPPPPGIGAIPTINVVHVMKNAGGNGGNDATGTRNRLDLPFETVDAAVGAMNPGDELWVWYGEFTTAGIIMPTDSSIHLMGDLVDAGGMPIIITGSGEHTIYGSGRLRVDNGGDGAILQGSTSVLKCYVPVSGTSHALPLVDQQEPSGILIVHGNITSTVGIALSSEGDATVYGNVSGTGPAARCIQGMQRIIGSVTGLEDSDAVSCTNGIQEVTGDVTTTGTGRAAVMNGTGTQTIRGNLSADAIAASMGAGLQVIYGNVTSTGARAAYMNGTGRQEIHGRVYSALSWGANCQAGTQIIYGDCISGGAGQAGAECNNGTQEIHGACTGTANSIGANMNGTGTQVVYGTCSSATNAGARCDAGTQTIYGDCTSTSGWGHFAGGGTSNLHGTIYCETDRAAFARAGAVVRYYGHVYTPNISAAAIEIGAGAAPALQLMGGAYLETGGAKSIQDPLAVGPTVRCYGAYANTGADGSVVIDGTLNLLP